AYQGYHRQPRLPRGGILMVPLSIMGMTGWVNPFCLAVRRPGTLSVARRRSAGAFFKDADRHDLPLVQPFARVDLPTPRPWDPSTEGRWGWRHGRGASAAR